MREEPEEIPVRQRRRSTRRSTREERRQSLNSSIDKLKELKEKRNRSRLKVSSILNSKSRSDVRESLHIPSKQANVQTSSFFTTLNTEL
jgi:hypothetical protein